MEKSKFYRIKNITEREYTLVGCDGSVITYPIQDVDKSASAFTIQDAKDGDVLSDVTTIFIFKDLLSDGSVMSYCDYDTDSGESGAFCPLSANLMCSKITPTTKEQRDLLFQKMHEAGWEFDFEKKELKKISQRMVSAEAKEAMYDKPTDLEIFINELSKQFPDVSFAKLSRIAVRVAKWAKPTDEEMKELLRTEYEKGRADTIAEMQKSTWSEEDECYMAECINAIATKDGWSFEEKRKTKHWLKSIKERL